MKRWFVGLAVLVSCGPPKPATTVPAPVVKAEPVASTPPPSALIPPQPTLRLPRNFAPTGYAARLEIDPARPGFEGAIQIAGDLGERSLVIWLNARKLTVHTAVARRPGQPDVLLTATAKGDDFLELRAAQPLEPGAWTLAIDYAGAFDALNTSGAFKQTVGDATYVYTQFEAVFARRAFPCFDEPDNKVPWKLTLDVPRALVAVSNTAITGEAPLEGNKKRVEFAQTRPLPSYLVAFGVGPFEIVDAGKTKRGTPVRIVALAHRAADAAYAAKTSARVIDLLEDYFATPYPYDKMDMLAIPLTVGFGAMENAGLITYTETLMLMDGKASNERRLRWISVAAHELAHQWFGDLVTMAYWDDIWLNEGFASWMGRKIVARFDPSWHEDQGELASRDTALESDSLVSARQIRQPIVTQDDIFTAFDRITYEKGASILNMFESYLGAETFQRGVRDYLAAHAYGNATSTDFAAAISKASGKDVSAAFATFLEQAGAPELTATLTCEGGKATVALAQQRYLPPGSGAPTATRPWLVPVCVAYDNAGKRAEACTQLEAATGALALDVTARPSGGAAGRGTPTVDATARPSGGAAGRGTPTVAATARPSGGAAGRGTPTVAAKACPRWVMPNVNGRGYYRNHYSAAQLTTLRDEAWPQLSWTERRAILFDAGEAVSTGQLPLALALSIVPKMLAGGDRFSISPAIALVEQLARMVPAELQPRYEAWMRQTFGPGALEAGLVPRAADTLDLELTRDALIRAVAWHGREPRLIAEAVKLADKWRDLPQSSRAAVLQLAVDARPEIFDRVMKDVAGEADRTKRQDMLRALAGVRDPQRQATALGLMLDARLDPRETLLMLGGGRGDRGGAPLGDGRDANLTVAQTFFRDHQAELMKAMPQDGTAGPFARLSALFTASCRAEQRDAVTEYVKKTFAVMPGGKRTVAQSLEQMEQCIARRAILEPEIRVWLTGAKPPARKPVPR